MTKSYDDRKFGLRTATAQRLYADHAAAMPVVDFHTFLSAKDIFEDRRWNNLSELWLNDPMKWRAMRAAAMAEKLCTDEDTTPEERFDGWAAAMQSAVGSPLCNISAMELHSVFGIDESLSAQNSRRIFDCCNEMLAQPEYSTRGLLRRQNVATLCTENDPTESLEYHLKLAAEPFETKVLPSWSADKAMAVEDPAAYKAYIGHLGAVAGVDIHNFDDLIEALQVRHNFFGKAGCRISIHRTEEICAEEYTIKEIERIFRKAARGKRSLRREEIRKFRSAVTVESALMDWRAGWSRIVCFGGVRDVNSRRFAQVGGHAGFDIVTDRPSVDNLVRLLDRLDADDHLGRTLLCNLNPAMSETVAVLAASFQDSRYGAGRVQPALGGRIYDSVSDMERRFEAMLSTGLLGSSVGCASETETVIGFARHEMFRRTLCNFIGDRIENGLWRESEIVATERTVENLCGANAVNFFGL